MKNMMLMVSAALALTGLAAESRFEVMDMVHHNPGEPFTVTAYADPAKVAACGMDAQVVNEFVFPQCAVTFDAFDARVFPEGSEERRWVMAQRDRMRAKAKACHAAGVRCYYFMDIIVLPARLVELHRGELCDARGRITFAKPLTERLHRMMLDELFTVVPELDGVVVRTGETYLNNTPYHVGNGPVDYKNAYEESKAVHAKLMNLLREEVCERKGRRVYYRTWDFGCFHTDPKYYLEVTERVPVHPLFTMSVKHTKGDYLRTFAFNPTLGVGRHRQIVEVQCAREYEGKGAFANYIANSVIDGYEENANDEGTKSLREFAKSPLFAGVWTWSRGGGSRGPFLKNEFWCDFNARVMAAWAKSPDRSEAEVFAEVAAKCGVEAGSLAAFRELCLLSQKAIIRGRGTMLKCGRDLRPYMKEPDNWLFVGWMRDDCLGGERQLRKTMDGLLADGLVDARLKEMEEAVRIWRRIVELASAVKCADKAVESYVLTSSLYGEVLHRVMSEGYAVVFRGYAAEKGGVRPDRAEIARHARAYELAWADFHRLAAERPDCASLYTDEYPHYIPKCEAVPSGVTHVDGLGAAVRKYGPGSTRRFLP